MRTTLIIFQAAVLSLLAIVGAQSADGTKMPCPVSAVQVGDKCVN